MASPKLRPHRREDLLTKVAPVECRADAACPTFEALLARIFAGDRDLIGFVQRAVGYSLTGDISERVLFILYGIGAPPSRIGWLSVKRLPRQWNEALQRWLGKPPSVMSLCTNRAFTFIAPIWPGSSQVHGLSRRSCLLAVDVALLAGRGLDDGVSFGDGAAAPHCPPMKAVLVADPTRAVPGVAFSRSSGVDHCSVLRVDRGEETVDRPARRLQPAPIRRHGDPNVGMPEHA